MDLLCYKLYIYLINSNIFSKVIVSTPKSRDNFFHHHSHQGNQRFSLTASFLSLDILFAVKANLWDQGSHMLMGQYFLAVLQLISMLCEACVQKRSLQLLQKITSRSRLEKIVRVPRMKRVQSTNFATLLRCSMESLIVGCLGLSQKSFVTTTCH